MPLTVKDVEICGPLGVPKADLALDTGAILTALSCSLLTAIGYDPTVAAAHVLLITATEVTRVPKLRIQSIAVGGLRANDVQVVAHDLPEPAGVQGVLGLSFLKHFRTVLDYPVGYLEIS